MDEALRRYQLDIARAQISRRRFMTGAALAGISGALAACGSSSSSSPSSAPSIAPASAAPGSAAPSAAATPAPSYALESDFYLFNWSDYFAGRRQGRVREEVQRQHHAGHIPVQRGAAGQAPGGRQGPVRRRGADGRVFRDARQRRLPRQARQVAAAQPGQGQPAVPDAAVRPQRRLHRAQGLGHHRDHLPRLGQGAGDVVEGVLRPRQGQVLRQDAGRELARRRVRRPAPAARLRRQHDQQGRARDRPPGAAGAPAPPPVDRLRQLPGHAAQRRRRAGPGLERHRVPDAAGSRRTRTPATTIPSEGTIYWVDTWVLLDQAPHPNAAYAFLNWIQEPDVQVDREPVRRVRELQRRRQDAAARRSSRTTRPCTSPTDQLANLSVATDQSGNKQRADIWAEFLAAG